jgi:hypothetical protein
MRILGLAAFAKQCVRFVKEENPPFMLRLIKDLGQVLSVSPIYLDTTSDRSTLYTSRSVDLPSKQAVMVLPVPGGP